MEIWGDGGRGKHMENMRREVEMTEYGTMVNATYFDNERGFEAFRK